MEEGKKGTKMGTEGEEGEYYYSLVSLSSFFVRLAFGWLPLGSLSSLDPYW